MKALVELSICMFVVWAVLAISSYSMRVGFDPMGENMTACRYWNGWEFTDTIVPRNYCPWIARTTNVAKCLVREDRRIVEEELRRCPL
jgi:hypothetical protein